MLKKETMDMLTFYAVSPIHAGSGNSTSAVDLPIQRERHTNWPHIQASAIKGAMRDHFRNFSDDNDLINLVFGLDNENDDKMQKTKDENGDDLTVGPGALSVSDAKLLAFPVRSNIAPFVWVTSPAVLKRFNSDLEFLGLKNQILNLEEGPVDEKAYSLNDYDFGQDKKVILEDAVVEVIDNKSIPFLNKVFPEVDKLLLISDKMYKYVVDNCTEIQTQITIDARSGTAKDGGLRYQELLPADSILYSVLYYSKTLNDLQADAVKEKVKKTFTDFIQIGGDETLGRGICKVKWLENGGVE